MIVNKEDIFILFRLHRAHLEGKEVSSWVMAKEYFICEGDEFEKDYFGDAGAFLSEKTNVIRYRLKRLQENGLLTIQKNSEKNVYSLNYEKVIPLITKFPKDKKKSKSLAIKNEYNKWDIFQI